MSRHLGLHIGIFCTLPACVWAAGAIHAAAGWHAAETLAIAVKTVWLLQALAIAAFAPAFRPNGMAWLANLAVPWPVAAVAWLAGALSGISIAKALLVLSAFSLLVQVGRSIIRQYTILDWADTPLGLALAAMVWRFSENWLGWLTA